jgi:hypothetical protein
MAEELATKAALARAREVRIYPSVRATPVSLPESIRPCDARVLVGAVPLPGHSARGRIYLSVHL